MTYQKPFNLLTPGTGRYYHPYLWPQNQGCIILPRVTADSGVRYVIRTPSPRFNFISIQIGTQEGGSTWKTPATSSAQGKSCCGLVHVAHWAWCLEHCCCCFKIKLRYHLHAIKFIIPNCDSVVLSSFTKLSHHHHHQIPDHVRPSRQTPRPFCRYGGLSLPGPACSGQSAQMRSQYCGPSCLASFTEHSVSEAHPC